MKTVPGKLKLTVKDGRYHYLQRRIPTDIMRGVDPAVRRAVLNTSGPVVKRYCGSDPNEAKREAALKWVELETIFQRLRGKGTALSHSASAEPAPVTLEALEAMAWALFVRERRDLERANQANPRPLDEVKRGHNGFLGPWRFGLDTDNWDAEITEATAHELAARNIILPATDPRFAQARRLVARAIIDAHEAVLRRLEGDYSFKPSLPQREASITLSSEGVPLLSDIYDAWKLERKPPAKTVTEFDKGIRRFKELHGDIPAATVTKAHVRAFKDALRRLPAVLAGDQRKMTVPDLLAATENAPPERTLSAGSINKDLGSLSAVLAWAGKQGYFDHLPDWSNPCSGLKVDDKATPEEKRLPYGSDDLKTIFGSSVFISGKRPRSGGGEAAKWLPLLGLFTGARLEELGQALVSDIRMEGGVHYLDINTLDEGKRLKTATSRRKVPIHPTLIRLGFLLYTDLVPQQEGRLFPALKPDQHGKITGNWSKWWGRYARDIGITDSRKVFHSFRHGFKDACRAAGIEEAIHDALTGHAGGGVGRSYGQGFPLSVLAEAVKKLSFPGFPL